MATRLVLQYARVPLGPRLRRSMCQEAKAVYLDKEKVQERVLGVVRAYQKVDPAKISLSSHFQKDLGFDSLDTVELVMAFEQEFGIEVPESDANRLSSCADTVDYIASLPNAK